MLLTFFTHKSPLHIIFCLLYWLIFRMLVLCVVGWCSLIFAIDMYSSFMFYTITHLLFLVCRCRLSVLLIDGSGICRYSFFFFLVCFFFIIACDLLFCVCALGLNNLWTFFCFLILLLVFAFWFLKYVIGDPCTVWFPTVGSHHPLWPPRPTIFWLSCNWFDTKLLITNLWTFFLFFQFCCMAA